MGKRPGKREANQQAKQKRIVAAAKSLFASKGHDATTTRDIARRARIAHGTLFLYAQTKADVVFLVWKQEIGEALQKAKETAPAPSSASSSPFPLTDFCIHFYAAFMGVYAQDPALAKALVKEVPWLEGPSRAGMMAMTFEVLSAIAARADAVGANGLLFAQASFSLYFGALTAWLTGELGDPAGDGRTTALAVLTEGLRLLEKGARS